MQVFGGNRKRGAIASNPTVFGREIVFEGDLVCSKPLQIKGRFTGSISSTADVTLEKTSDLKLESIRAQKLVAKGRLDAASIEAAELEVHGTARVTASIFVRSFRARAGAGIVGSLDMESARKAPSSPGNFLDSASAAGSREGQSEP